MTDPLWFSLLAFGVLVAYELVIRPLLVDPD